MTPDFDVAVVGMGPVGVTLANLLGLRGLKVLVVDREAAIYDLPRAVQLDGECMRVFQTIGASAALATMVSPVPGMRFVDPDGRLLVDWARSMETGKQGWKPSYRFHQPDLETCLRALLKRFPSVEPRLRHDVFAVEAASNHVVLRMENLSSGQLIATTARYVVGCDGARSTIRRFIGSELTDLKSHERWLVLDLILTAERPDLGDYSVQYCDPERPSTYVRGIGMRRRWEIMLRPHEDAAAITRPDSVWHLLGRWLKPDEAVIERSAIYTFHSVIADTWRKGRLLVAGDAAHQTPPFMGQGMCTGIRDVANLAWKLADVIAGRSADGLLDTYQSERSPHAQVFITEAVRLGMIIRAIGVTSVGGSQGGGSVGGTGDNEPERFVTPQPKLGPGVHDNSELGGRIAEQPVLDGGEFLDDVVGYYSVVLTREDFHNKKNYEADDLKFVTASSVMAKDWLDRLNCYAIIVRPDRYIYAVARSETDLDACLDSYRVARWVLTAGQTESDAHPEPVHAH